MAGLFVYSGMKRDIEASLNAWVSKGKRKPLILVGPRQVGKTWLMKTLGENHFEGMAYINFEREINLQRIFNDDLDPHRILQVIEIATSVNIRPGKTLVILDEIQEAPNGLTALKYFCEELPDLHIIAAGSLLGVGLKTRSSFPVGKVELLHVHPMSFNEYLNALGETALSAHLKAHQWDLLNAFHDKLVNLLKTYYVVGGMPEVVDTYVRLKDLEEVRKVQEQILMAYERDFSKHAPSAVVPRILQVWEGLLAQLAKENKKFIYGLIRSGARAKEYEAAIDWLLNYGLITKVTRTTKIERPLSAFADTKAFKIYIHDVGLLSAKAALHPDTILNGNALFKQFKGALTEQCVLQQHIAHGHIHSFYWENPSGQAEVDFLFEGKDALIPLEVKASENLQSKSLKVFHSKYPQIPCFRTSLARYRHEEWLTNLPLYSLPVTTDQPH